MMPKRTQTSKLVGFSLECNGLSIFQYRKTEWSTNPVNGSKRRVFELQKSNVLKLLKRQLNVWSFFFIVL